MAAVAASAVASSAGAQPSATDAPRPAVPDGQIPVAFIVDEGANMIDLAGPWEVFQDSPVGPGRAFFLYAVGPERRQYFTTGNGAGSGLPFIPNFTFADAPQPGIVVMGAQGGPDDPAKIAWIRRVEPRARIVMSVCTGAFLLARTGLLDGKSATTHHDYFDGFAELFPAVNLVRGRRFVDNGKFISAGGLTSGIDAALHVVATVLGDAAAESTAEYMEYDSRGWRGGQRAGT